MHLGAHAARQRARGGIARPEAGVRPLLVQKFRDRERVPDHHAVRVQHGNPAARAHARDARFRLVGIERNDDLLALDPALANEQRAANRPRGVVAIADVELRAHVRRVPIRGNTMNMSAQRLAARENCDYRTRDGGGSWDTAPRLQVSFMLVGTTSYFIRRLLLIIPTFIGITLLVFAVTRVVPGGPDRANADPGADVGRRGSAPAQRRRLRCCPTRSCDQLRVYYGFDKPIFVSYVTGSARCSARSRPLDALQRAGLGNDQAPLPDLDLLRRHDADPDLRDLHSARHLESDPSPHPVRQRELRLRVPRLCDSGLRRRHRAADVLRVAARLVSARRLRQRQLRSA